MTTGREAVAAALTDCPPAAEVSSLTSLSAPPGGWPDPAAPDAFYGLAGEVVRTISPHTEADPHAVLAQFLAAFGSAVGRGPGFEAESTFHGTNLYLLIVGATSKGRKGSSWSQASRPVEMADETWPERVVSGLSSGEGLIHAVRDPQESRRKARKGETLEADDEGYVTEITDHGEEDKRVFALESEFAGPLRSMRREGSTLSPVLRQAWESGRLQTLTRNSPLRATGAHVAVAGHISQEELRRELQSTDTASGFANRFLFVCACRSQALPEGGSLADSDWQEIVPELRLSIKAAQVRGVMRRDEDARALWAKIYGDLSEGKPELYGAVTSRAEAQVMRLAVIHALLDRSDHVRVPHLRAALALWEYCAASARHIFGDALGDDTADVILSALRSSSEGMRRTAIRDLFGRHKAAGEIERALNHLASLGLASKAVEQTGGRPAETWTARAESDVSDLTPLASLSALPSHLNGAASA